MNRRRHESFAALIIFAQGKSLAIVAGKLANLQRGTNRFAKKIEVGAPTSTSAELSTQKPKDLGAAAAPAPTYTIMLAASLVGVSPDTAARGRRRK